MQHFMEICETDLTGSSLFVITAFDMQMSSSAYLLERAFFMIISFPRVAMSAVLHVTIHLTALTGSLR